MGRIRCKEEYGARRGGGKQRGKNRLINVRTDAPVPRGEGLRQKHDKKNIGNGNQCQEQKKKIVTESFRGVAVKHTEPEIENQKKKNKKWGYQEKTTEGHAAYSLAEQR